MKELPRIMYHGTFFKQSVSIRKTGFRKGTYFTPYLDSAMVMGGPFVFKVWFTDEEQLSRAESWQHISRVHVSKTRIIWLRFIVPTLVLYNQKADDQMRKYDMSKKHPDMHFCTKCKGRGQLENHDEYASQWKLGLPVTPCPACNGYGVKTPKRSPSP